MYLGTSGASVHVHSTPFSSSSIPLSLGSLPFVLLGRPAPPLHRAVYVKPHDEETDHDEADAGNHRFALGRNQRPDDEIRHPFNSEQQRPEHLFFAARLPVAVIRYQ